jgi:DNA-binding MarR family transcriptional regulator
LLQNQVAQLMTLYPRIYFACHLRHVQDERTKQILSAHQASILDHLDEFEPLTLRRLAAHMGVTASTMSLGIDRLIQQGYVTRTRDPRDARQVELRLTKAGVRVKSEKSVLDPKRVRQLLGCLTEEERVRALDGLSLLATAGGRAMEASRA